MADPVTGFDHALWDNVLKSYVVVDKHKHTWVDYQKIKNDSAALQPYLVSLSRVSRADFQNWPKDERLAFLINAYNAWTIQLVVENYPVESIRDIGSLLQSPWKKAFIPLLGEVVSLDGIEHGMIRASGRYEELRIHFALNCASVGCPPLRQEAYTADRLDQQLQAQTRQFLADRTQNRQAGKVLELSAIFKWYRGDFEKGWLDYHSLDQFLLAYSSDLGLSDQAEKRLQAGEFKLRFLEYDWRLNDLANKPG